ncbi:cytochrome P450 [Streptomyces yunnanensis]|uniref:Cytochrome P450 n=1 Tax=Streptomyces yunnanensis TaxID=156453 RepID=A0A9X8N1Q9_9ACTN|nr:cytochrome P450 [Streptomyces yunnanensis]SHM66884.1 Cytochrome P450 [Streptomyces yunnanensis]
MSPSTSAEDLGIDLADPVTLVRSDLDDVFRHLRREHPVFLHPGTATRPAFWVLSRYDDVLAVYKDAATFVSHRGNMLTSLLDGGDPAGGRLLAVTDGPRHTALRAKLLKSFAPRSLQRVVDRVRRRADERVAAAVALGTCDFAAEVAEDIPMGTICDLLGVPPSDRAGLLRLSKQALSSDDADQTAEDAWLARNDILLYFAELAEIRRAEPRDDLISTLASIEVEGAVLTEDEIVLNCYGLLLAGDETSRLAMSGAVWTFARHPEQWTALKEGTAQLPTAVEELLRWTTPAMHVGRTAARDVEIGGRTIRAGDIVTAWNLSANRDEAAFTNPDVLDLTRSPNRHLTFGYGPHFCLGAYLARAEITAVVDALLRRVGEIEPVGDPEPVYSTFLRGYSGLNVRLGPAAGMAR